MLQTRFPRLPGDVGHPASWRMPVRFWVVTGATPQRVVREADRALLTPFIAAGQTLVAQGARAITTSCGFLMRWQHELQAALPVPVWSSALLALPQLRRPGVITVDAQALDERCLRAAGASADTPVQGLALNSSLQRTLLQDLLTLDAEQAEAEVLEAGRALLQRAPGVDSLVLECTNLPPYAQALQRATGLPVHHLMSLVHQRWYGLT